jgi:V8-like Glu-specific endopeptidase
MEGAEYILPGRWRKCICFMTFQSHLDNARIHRLTQAAVQGDVPELNRSLLMQGILRSYVVNLPRDPAPLTQFQLDLYQLNSVEQLADGKVPLFIYLKNIAGELALRGRKEADVFDEAANLVGRQTSGVPALPDPQQQPEIVKNEAIAGGGGMVDFKFLLLGNRTGKSVARILVPRFENGAAVSNNQGGPWVMKGTAWVVGPKLLLTNHHVINARLSGEIDASPDDFKLQALRGDVQFDYDDETSEPKNLKIAALEAVSKVLDYALIRLEADIDREPIALASKRVEVTSTTFLPVNIIQHPGGLHKQVAFRNNLATGADQNFVRYLTDTDAGSSGSPVCDDTWHVVALHRGARQVEKFNFQGKPSAYLNYGTQIQSVLEDLQQTNGATYAAIAEAQAALRSRKD